MNSLKLKGRATTDVMRLVPEPPKRKAKKKGTCSCKRCGNKGHQPWKCWRRHKDSKCNKCHKVGHLAKVCRSRSTDKQGGETKWIGSYVDTEECDELPLYTINSKLNKPFLVDLHVKGKVINFKVDTGAAVTIMSSDNFRHHFPNDFGTYNVHKRQVTNVR